MTNEAKCRVYYFYQDGNSFDNTCLVFDAGKEVNEEEKFVEESFRICFEASQVLSSNCYVFDPLDLDKYPLSDKDKILKAGPHAARKQIKKYQDYLFRMENFLQKKRKRE